MLKVILVVMVSCWKKQSNDWSNRNHRWMLSVDSSPLGPARHQCSLLGAWKGQPHHLQNWDCVHLPDSYTNPQGLGQGLTVLQNITEHISATFFIAFFLFNGILSAELISMPRKEQSHRFIYLYVKLSQFLLNGSWSKMIKPWSLDLDYSMEGQR